MANIMALLLLSFLLLIGSVEPYAVCSCCTPCVQQTPVCPPPIICQPPPPPCICPPPPPPPPCIPMCPPPPPPPPPMIENTCCVMCVDPCSFAGRKKREILEDGFSLVLKNTIDDPICNDMELKRIMEDNLENDTSTSRQKIKQAAEAKLHAKIGVMCARGEFSYSAYTESFCQVRKDDLTCYAFRMSIK